MSTITGTTKKKPLNEFYLSLYNISMDKHKNYAVVVAALVTMYNKLIQINLRENSTSVGKFVHGAIIEILVILAYPDAPEKLSH